MFAMTRPRMLVAVLVGVAFAALLALAAVTSSVSATHTWSTYHWAHTTNPMPLDLGDNVNNTSYGAKWDTYLRETAGLDNDQLNDWKKPYLSYPDFTYSPEILDTKVVASGVNPKRCPATDGRVEVCNASYGYTGWLGVAQIWLSSGHITKGTAKLNDSYFKNTTRYPEAKRQSVMCQEVGHVFGLDHQDENHSNTNLGTCMDYTNDADGDGIADDGVEPDDDNRHPNKHDYEQLTVIYDKHDTTSAVAKMPARVNQADMNNPSEWGKLIERSPDGLLEVYERSFGGGYGVRTFVIKAERDLPLKKPDQQQQQKQDQ